MRNRLLITVTLLVGGFSLLFFFRDWRGGADSRPIAPGAQGIVWAPGAAQSYSISIHSTVRLKLPGEVAAQALEQELSGTLGMKVFDGDTEEAQVGFQLFGASYMVNGQPDQALAERLELPFTVLFKHNGRPLAFSFPKALEKTERNILEESIRTFQVLLPEEPRGTWTSSEEHSTGHYLAHYRFREDGYIEKRKTLYTDLSLSSEEAGGEPMEAQLRQSLGTIELSGQSSWIDSAILQETVSFSGGEGLLTSLKMRAELERMPAGEEEGALALFSAGRPEELYAIAESLSVALEPSISPDASFTEEEGQPEVAAAGEWMASGEALEVLLEELNSIEKSGRIPLLKRIEELLLLNPGLSYEVAERVRGPDSTGAADAWLIHLLERSGTIEAQDALSMVMADPTYRNWNRVQAAVALGGVKEPTGEAIEALLSMASSRNGVEEKEVSNAALLAVGSLGKTLSATDYIRSQAIAQELTASLHGSRDPTEAAVVLKAMENMGEPALGDAIHPYLENSEPFVRGAAASALGRLKSEGATDLLSSRLTLEEDRHVRSSIVIALEQAGGATARSLASVKERVLVEPEANTRYHMAKYLGDNIGGHPENIKTLQVIALKDPSSRVRQYARKVLIEVKGN